MSNDVVGFDFEAGCNVARGNEDPSMTLHGTNLDTACKWVRLPPDLGGERVDVVGQCTIDCPCGEHDAEALVTDAVSALEGVSLVVAECTTQRRYLWMMVGNAPRDRASSG